MDAAAESAPSAAMGIGPRTPYHPHRPGHIAPTSAHIRSLTHLLDLVNRQRGLRSSNGPFPELWSARQRDRSRTSAPIV